MWGERTQPADTLCERQPPLRQRRASRPLVPRKRDGSPRRTAATGRSPAAAPAAESSALTPEELGAMPRRVAAPRRLPVERPSATGAASRIVRQRAGRARNSRAPRRPRDRRAGPTRRASVPSASPPRGARGGAKRGLGKWLAWADSLASFKGDSDDGGGRPRAVSSSERHLLLLSPRGAAAERPECRAARRRGPKTPDAAGRETSGATRPHPGG